MKCVAGYAIETDGIIEHHTTPYDVDRLVKDLRDIALLSHQYVETWVNNEYTI